LLLTFGLSALGFAFMAGGGIIAWLQGREHDRLSVVALMTGLAVGGGSAFATIAGTPVGSPVLSDEFRLGVFLGLGLVVVATGSEAFRGLMELARERDWFRVALWFVGVALLVGLLVVVRR
jgi:dolichol kinase